MTEQKDMDLLELLEVFESFKKNTLITKDRLKVGSIEFAERSQAQSEIDLAKAKELWATCSDRLKNIPLKDLPVSVGDIKTTLSELLDEK